MSRSADRNGCGLEINEECLQKQVTQGDIKRYLYSFTTVRYSPAALASLHASYISFLISGLSSAIVSPTVTNRSTAKFTACPTREMARRVRSVVVCGRVSERCETKFDI